MYALLPTIVPVGIVIRARCLLAASRYVDGHDILVMDAETNTTLIFLIDDYRFWAVLSMIYDTPH